MVYEKRKRIGLVFLLFFLPSLLYSFPAKDIELLEGNHYFPRVKQLLEKAESSIYVVMYEMRYYSQYPLSPSNQLIQELIKAGKRGVNVTVILDVSSYNEKNTQRNKEVGKILSKNGIEVKYDSMDITTHAKVVIVDERYCVVGSHNWSYYALTKNKEVSLLLDSPALAEEITKWIKGKF